uniref:Uncharacterized protein n=1 Tax=Leersia perrieri TaxID=77586 RepID=A0A0D9WYE8_9ORYZ
MLQTLLSPLKRYHILSKLLWLARESFGLATAWLSHQKTGIFSVLMLQWLVQACINFLVK